jgi:hypothetical protein
MKPDEEKQLLRYFMEQTDKRFDKVDGNFAALHDRLDTLNDFKVRTIVSTRWISGIISASLGLLTFCVTVGTTIYLSRLERHAIIDAAKIEKPQTVKKDDL